MLLLYDSKCAICRGLAYKIHFLTEKTVEIQSLYSPEAEEVLGQFYPNGWQHDFYVVNKGACRRGLRALPGLMRSLGLKRMASLVAEYGTYKLAPQTCGHANGNGDGVLHTKRNFLKAAALSPLLYGFSKLPLEDPFKEEPTGGLGVFVAEVKKTATGELRAKAYRCTACNRTPNEEKGLPPGASKRLLDSATLAEDSVPGFSTKAQGLANFMVKRVEYERDMPENGQLVTERRTVYSALLDHARYNLAVNIGLGRRTMLAGMARHDLPVATLDYVIFRPDTEEDAVTHMAAYQVGIRELSKLHRREGRAALARVYNEMAQGFGVLHERFGTAAAERLVPDRNEIVITSMPEMLRFVQKPAHLQHTEKACDCSCSCNLCCGCGCSLGLCLEPVSPCGCDCCLACGCGCGCCL